MLVAECETFVYPRRGVALQTGADRLAVAAFGDELARRRQAVDALTERAIAGHARMAKFQLELGGERERDVEPIGRQQVGGTLGPFDQHHGSFGQVVEAELGKLGRR